MFPSTNNCDGQLQSLQLVRAEIFYAGRRSKLSQNAWMNVNNSLSLSLSLSLSNGTTARGGPRPPSRVSSILPGLGRLLSSFCTLALLHLLSLHLPNAEHSRSLTKIHSFSNVFYSVSCLVVVLPSVRFSLC